jgi:hypothetical protein
LAAKNYTLTLRSFTAGSSGFQDTLGSPLDGNNSGIPGSNFKITFSVNSPPVAVGLPDFARGPSNTDALFLPTTIGNGGLFNLSYTNPAASPNTGTATITFSTTLATLQSNIQTALNNLPQVSTSAVVPNTVVVVLNDNASGANVLVTFQNGLVTATNQLLASATAGVSIGLANINVANSIPGNGIPVALSNAQGVTSGSFTLQYNPALLTITGAVSKIAGASFTINNTINNATSATAVLSLSSPVSISAIAGPLTIGSLLASVPFSVTATYGAKQVLHFSSVSLNGTAGPIAVTNQDAVEIAAYFGDVSASGGPFNINDAAAIALAASQIPNTLAQTIPGFEAFPNLDPVIVGDVALQGFVNSTDASVINQQLVAARPAIPFAPSGLTFTQGGPSVVVASGQPIGVVGQASGVSSPRSEVRGERLSGSSVATAIPFVVTGFSRSVVPTAAVATQAASTLVAQSESSPQLAFGGDLNPIPDSSDETLLPRADYASLPDFDDPADLEGQFKRKAKS